MMVHVGCGGEVAPDPAGSGYQFTGEEAKQFGSFVPRYLCLTCGKEIYSDHQVELVDTANL